MHIHCKGKEKQCSCIVVRIQENKYHMNYTHNYEFNFKSEELHNSLTYTDDNR
jgi:hypothetical protein